MIAYHRSKWIATGICVLLLTCITAQAAPVNGVKLNGIADNGIRLNGLRINGIRMNGINLNGTANNGLRFNGIHLNGFSPNHFWLRRMQVNSASLQDRDLPGDNAFNFGAMTIKGVQR